MSIQQALALAEQEELDLVLMNDTVNPPICRLMNYSKYRYEKEKRAKANKTVKHAELKEIKMKCQIMDRDIEIKVKNMRRILKEGDKVKATIRFRGREIAYIQNGPKILSKCVEMLSDIAVPVGSIRTEHNIAYVILQPK